MVTLGMFWENKFPIDEILYLKEKILKNAKAPRDA